MRKLYTAHPRRSAEPDAVVTAKVTLFFGIVVLGLVALFWVWKGIYAQQMHLQGDPYQHRAQGAAGICQVVGEDANDYRSVPVYRCGTQAERDQAAAAAKQKFEQNARSTAWTVTILVLVMEVLCWPLLTRWIRKIRI